MEYSFFFVFVYLVASFQEWFFHKYLMHQESYAIFNGLHRNHMLHHATTKKDYTIKNDKTDYICVEVFSKDGIIQSILLFSINTGFFYILFPNISIHIITTTVAGMLSVNILVWNTIHSYVHGFDPSIICSPKGVPKKFLSEKNGIVKWLVNNHKRHHDNKNTNYNIVFPGADYFMGTFMETIENEVN